MPRILPRPLLVLPAVLLLLLLGITWLLFQDTSSGPSRPAVHGNLLPPESKTIVALQTSVPAWIELVGEVRPRGEIAVSTQVQAKVSRVLVRTGDRVESGTPLLQLDDREFQARLAQSRHDLDALDAALLRAHNIQERTQAEFDLAQAEFSRINALHAQGAAAASELDQARAGLLAARAEHGQAEQSIQELRAGRMGLRQRIEELSVALGHTVVRASESGIIARRDVEPGNVAHPGQTLLLLHSLEPRLEVHVPERYLDRIAVGQTLEARVDALDSMFLARVDELEPAGRPGSRSFLAKLEVAPELLRDTSALRSGMFVRVRLSLPSEQYVLIPEDAVLRVGQLAMVAVVREEATYALRHVRLGRTFDYQVEVLSGLQGGERLWLHPTPTQ
ncbi:efflux RND transporter periplasmic adaptor subunit [Desulfonatronum thioautotrophicum]|uniref:efflux RND transporter periplasmic adaptor subunit n=1 Tax=Desulfonatronum thioautotrophicum TaxID=617001 RepID=UPI0005EB4F27|nr:efflux RND transporter periplasmic adaptor subunit [Desulfonatronum thioautotrophicum]